MSRFFQNIRAFCFLLVLSATALQGCGQKGDLYIPVEADQEQEEKLKKRKE